VWQVGVFDAGGNPAPFQQAPTGTGLLLSFRPSPVFRMGRDGKPGVKYNVKTSLQVSDKPLVP